MTLFLTMHPISRLRAYSKDDTKGTVQLITPGSDDSRQPDIAPSTILAIREAIWSMQLRACKVVSRLFIPVKRSSFLITCDSDLNHYMGITFGLMFNSD